MKRILIFLLLLNALIYANSYALVIGIDGNGLVGASNDALIMQTLLVKKHIKNIKLLTNENATKNRIIKEFSSIANRAKRGDYIYLFFSGHGTNENDPNISDKLKKQLKETGGLVPYGLKKLNYKGLIVIKRDLVKYFKELERKRTNTVIIFDACFSGDSFKGFQPVKGYLSLYHRPSRDYSNYPYKHITFLSASTKLDSTAESAKKRRGFYSMALTKCLKKNSQFTQLKSCIRKEYKFRGIFLSKNKKQSLFPL
jgi:uncharacterized caspase-like protein